MTGAFCGSLSTRPAPVATWWEDLRAQGFVPASPARAGDANGPGHTLWRSADLQSSGFHAGNETFVMLLGAPRWSDSETAPGLAIDSAELARRFEAEGASILPHLRGDFSLAILRPSRGEALLAVDRFAIRNLFYLSDGPDLTFATRLATLASHPLVAYRVTPQAIYDYLYFHSIPGPETVHSGARRLLPGHFLYHHDGRSVTGAYWSPTYPERLQEAEAVARLPTVLAEAVAVQAGDDPLGCFLSGGLDSSTVTGMAARLRPGGVTAFTIGFDAEAYDEMAFAREAAQHFGVRHQHYYVKPEDVADALPAVVTAFDGPFGNASAIPTYFCARLAREHGFSGLLAGDGGDELFGGNSRYARELMFETYQRVPRGLRERALEPLAARLPQWSRRGLVAKAASYVQQAAIPLPDRLMSWNLLNRIPLADMLNPDFRTRIDVEAPLRRLREMYQAPAGTSLVNRLLHLDLRLTLADSDLPKVTRMSALAGIRVGFPFLAEEVFALAADLPPSAKVTANTLRPLYRRALSDFLPPATLTKRKQGFGLPFGLWLQKDPELRDFAGQQLALLEERGVLHPGFRARFLATGPGYHPGYHGVLVWILMTLGLWLRTTPAKF